MRMSRRSIHTSPFTGTWRDALSLVVAYRVPELIFVMIFIFFVSVTWFLAFAAASFHQLHTQGAHGGPYLVTLAVTYLVVGDTFFLLLLWSFTCVVLTCGGYVPAEPWRHVPRTDDRVRRRVVEQWAWQQLWLQQHRYRVALEEYERMLQRVMGAPAMGVYPAPAAAPRAAGGEELAEAQMPTGEAAAAPAPNSQVAVPVHESSPAPLRSSPPRCDCAHGVDRATAGLPAVAVNGGPRAFPTPAPCTNTFTVHEYEADGSLRYCDRCAQFKPDGCHHCRVCDRCTVFMDHHCHYVNNCIGLKNYKYFFLTLTYGTMCGTLCPLMILHMFRELTRVTPARLMLGYNPASAADTYYDFVSQVTELADAVQPSYMWLALPISMTLVNVLVLHLWRQHVALLMRGRTTLERMQEVSLENFLHRMNVARYGRCAPQTNRWCALLAGAREWARGLLRGAHRTDEVDDKDDDGAYAKLLAMAAEEADGWDAGRKGGPHMAGEPHTADRDDEEGGAGSADADPREPSLLAPGSDSGRGSARVESRREEDRRRAHRRRCFGEPAHWWYHLLPLAPRRTGEVVGLAETATPATKHL